MMTFSSATKCSPTPARRAHGEHAAGEALAGVVVGVALAASKVTPGASQPPKLWPAEPRKSTTIESSRQPLGAVRAGDVAGEDAADAAVDVADRQLDAHGVRSTARAVGAPACDAARLDDRPRSARPAASRARPRAPRGGGSTRWRGAPSRAARCGARMWVRSTPRAFQCSIACPAPSRSTRPIASSSERRPSEARISRTSSATKKKKLTTCSGVPLKRLRSSGSWVAMPTGQVFRWQARIMMQPVAISGRGGEAHLVGAEQRGDRRRRGRSSAGRRSARRCASAGR